MIFRSWVGGGGGFNAMNFAFFPSIKHSSSTSSVAKYFKWKMRNILIVLTLFFNPKRLLLYVYEPGSSRDGELNRRFQFLSNAFAALFFVHRSSGKLEKFMVSSHGERQSMHSKEKWWWGDEKICCRNGKLILKWVFGELSWWEVFCAEVFKAATWWSDFAILPLVMFCYNSIRSQPRAPRNCVWTFSFFKIPSLIFHRKNEFSPMSTLGAAPIHENFSVFAVERALEIINFSVIYPTFLFLLEHFVSSILISPSSNSRGESSAQWRRKESSQFFMSRYCSWFFELVFPSLTLFYRIFTSIIFHLSSLLLAAALALKNSSNCFSSSSSHPTRRSCPS